MYDASQSCKIEVDSIEERQEAGALDLNNASVLGRRDTFPFPLPFPAALRSTCRSLSTTTCARTRLPPKFLPFTALPRPTTRGFVETL